MKTAENLAPSLSFKDKYLGNIIRLVILALMIILCLPEPFKFGYGNTMEYIGTYGLISTALAIVMIGGGFDFSLLAIAILSASIGGMALDNGYGFIQAALAACGCGIICGLINGILCAKLRLMPYLATLLTGGLYFACAAQFTDVQSMRFIKPETYAEIYKLFNSGTIDVAKDGAVNIYQQTAAVSPVLYVPIALIFIIAIIVYKSKWGLALKATGSNARAAYECGVNPSKIRLISYIIAGILCALAGILNLIGGAASITPNMAALSGFTPHMLMWVTPALIGGCTGFGGRGSIIGTFIGTLIIFITPQFVGNTIGWTAHLCILSLLALIVHKIAATKKSI